MRELASSVSRKGQVTIPIEVRRLLRIAPGDKVAFLVNDGQVRLGRSGGVVARTAGMLKPEGRPLSAEDLRAKAEIAIAEETTERSGA